MLWTPPHIDPGDRLDAEQFAASEPVQRHGGVAIPVEESRTRQDRFGLPAVEAFPRTVRRDLFETFWTAGWASVELVRLRRTKSTLATVGAR